eukprot:Clim_evm4s50 gene=Clim_evmTU4s50
MKMHPQLKSPDALALMTLMFLASVHPVRAQDNNNDRNRNGGGGDNNNNDGGGSGGDNNNNDGGGGGGDNNNNDGGGGGDCGGDFQLVFNPIGSCVLTAQTTAPTTTVTVGDPGATTTPPSQTSDTQAQSVSEPVMSVGAIVGTVVGAAILAAIVAVLLVHRRHKRQRRDAEMAERDKAQLSVLEALRSSAEKHGTMTPPQRLTRSSSDASGAGLGGHGVLAVLSSDQANLLERGNSVNSATLAALDAEMMATARASMEQQHLGTNANQASPRPSTVAIRTSSGSSTTLALPLIAFRRFFRRNSSADATIAAAHSRNSGPYDDDGVDMIDVTEDEADSMDIEPWGGGVRRTHRLTNTYNSRRRTNDPAPTLTLQRQMTQPVSMDTHPQYPLYANTTIASMDDRAYDSVHVPEPRESHSSNRNSSSLEGNNLSTVVPDANATATEPVAIPRRALFHQNRRVFTRYTITPDPTSSSEISTVNPHSSSHGAGGSHSSDIFAIPADLQLTAPPGANVTSSENSLYDTPHHSSNSPDQQSAGYAPAPPAVTLASVMGKQQQPSLKRIQSDVSLDVESNLSSAVATASSAACPTCVEANQRRWSVLQNFMSQRPLPAEPSVGGSAAMSFQQQQTVPDMRSSYGGVEHVTSDYMHVPPGETELSMKSRILRETKDREEKLHREQAEQRGRSTRSTGDSKDSGHASTSDVTVLDKKKKKMANDEATEEEQHQNPARRSSYFEVPMYGPGAFSRSDL